MSLRDSNLLSDSSRSRAPIGAPSPGVSAPGISGAQHQKTARGGPLGRLPGLVVVLLGLGLGLLFGALPQRAAAMELVVGISNLDYAPFYYEEEGEIVGAAADIAKAIAAQMGDTLVFERFPWKRVQNQLASGDIDLVMLYFKTPERAKHVYYLDQPHIHEDSSLFTLKGKDIPFTGDLHALTPYTFGFVRGYSHGAEFDGATYLQKFEILSEERLIKMLRAERFDIAVGNEQVMTFIAKKLGVADQLAFLQPIIDRSPDYIAFSKALPDAEELTRKYSAALRDFMKTDDYKAILSRYGFPVPMGIAQTLDAEKNPPKPEIEPETKPETKPAAPLFLPSGKKSP